MEIDLIDFNKYYDPKDVKDYELFIGPDGEYYKVKTRYESYDNVTHYQWAMAYLKKYNMESFSNNEKLKKHCKTPLEFLINYLGFVRYTHSSNRQVYFTFPNPIYFNKYLSKEQVDAIYKILSYNKDRVGSDVISAIDSHTEKKSTIADNYFEKLKGRR